MKGKKELYYQLYLLSLSVEDLKRLYCAKLFYGDSELQEKLKLIHQELDYRRVIRKEV